MYTRRRFLGTTAIGTLSSSLLRAQENADRGKKRVAVVTTSWAPQSPTHELIDRLLIGYPFDGEWRSPPLEVAAAYVAEHPPGDLANQRSTEFGFPLCQSILDAMRIHGERISVDGILLLANHGDKDAGEQDAKRCEKFLDQILTAFEREQLRVPVYVEGPIATSFLAAQQTLARAKSLELPLMCGSSLPLTWRLPSIEMPRDVQVREALVVGFGDRRSGLFHGLEALQAMLERRSM